MFNIGSGELVLIAVVALLILGPKRLPELARGLGKFLREFRRQTDEVRGIVEREFYKMDTEMDASPPPALKPANDPVPTGGVEDEPMDHSDPRHPDYGKPDPHVLPEEAPVPVVNQHTDPTPPQQAAEPTLPAPGAEPPPAIFTDLTKRVAALTAAGRSPGLGTVLVGDDPGSHAYVRGKHADCAKVGINSIRRDLPADISQAELNAVIDELNANPECTGYIVQLPLPKHLDENAALERIDPGKDADGQHPTNLGRLVLNEPAPLPCTPRGIVHLLRRFEVPIAGAHVVVIGRGLPGGRPMGLLLTRRSENATVTLCHTGTAAARSGPGCGWWRW